MASVNANDGRMIVGFADWFELRKAKNFSSPEIRASHEIDRVIGFRRIIKIYKYINAALVEIDESKCDKFIADVIKKDPVIYCNRDYIMKKSAFSEQIHNSRRIFSGKPLKRHHIKNARGSDGLGICIGLIDTGIAPHPFLPALSFYECSARYESWHSSMRIDSRISEKFVTSLAVIEGQVSRLYKDCKEYLRLLPQFQAEFAKFADNGWMRWGREVDDWVLSKRTTSVPVMPKLSKIEGALRKISMHSWNFVDDNPDVLDKDGHGTEMAGFVSALKPIFGYEDECGQMDSIRSASYPVPFNDRYLMCMEPNVYGFAPYAELCILKCRDDSKESNSTVSAVISAMEHAKDNGVDVIYFGLTIESLPYDEVKALEDVISVFSSVNSECIFSPAGNDGAPVLWYPAALPGVAAVTGVDPVSWSAGFTLSSKSNYIDSKAPIKPRQYVSYCAVFGGPDGNEYLTVGADYGFSNPHGTSVSAAVAAGVYVAKVSRDLYEEKNSIYNSMMSLNSIDKVIIRSSIEGRCISAVDHGNAHKYLRQNAGKSMIQGGVPDDKFGYGLIRLTY